ncbi:TrmH family RNA methyltransferase [Candidatus Oscillochloris fontis]|uniref:TrmH family RNA methyltransferase n=1 Tax=Candidatus Oscillochloris fontis TaxID=2496868 RepID=UPI00101B83CE|nr:RNA methyltransferase [Candidatus Oscillochloris fontis]
MIITSAANPSIRQIRALRQRKERERSGHFFVEGVRLVGEAVALGMVETLVVAPDLLTSQFAHDLVAQHAGRTRVLEVSTEVFASLSQKEGPQGLAAVARQRWLDLADVQLRSAPGWVALVEPADPGNVGTILRTADAVGASGVILLDHATDPYDPAALRASMGAIFALQVVRATFAQFAAWKRAQAIYVVGAADTAATHYQDPIYPQPLVLLMGSERQGLSPDQQALCDQMVHLPMCGRSDSLNLAVATGVLLYELLSQSRRALLSA